MTTINFLFWNLHNNEKTLDAIINISRRNNVDVLIFIENTIAPEKLLQTLNHSTNEYYYVPPLVESRFSIFTKFNFTNIIDKYISRDRRLEIKIMNLPDMLPINLAFVHLPSKIRMDREDQYSFAQRTYEDLFDVENNIGNRRTLLIGDFNMNPFERGMINVLSFNATYYLKEVRRGMRTYSSNDYYYFYNPMWNLLGEFNHDILGTYYYHSPPDICYWNIFDQVLIRPELVNIFDVRSLKILTSDGINSFLTENEIPDLRNYSDHLPLFFSLKY